MACWATSAGSQNQAGSAQDSTPARGWRSERTRALAPGAGSQTIVEHHASEELLPSEGDQPAQTGGIARLNRSLGFQLQAHHLPLQGCRRGTTQVGQQTGIKKVGFGCFDNPRQAVGQPRLQSPNQKQLLQHAHMFRGCLVVQQELASQLVEIDQLPRHLGQGAQRLRDSHRAARAPPEHHRVRRSDQVWRGGASHR